MSSPAKSFIKNDISFQFSAGKASFRQRFLEIAFLATWMQSFQLLRY
jgi:hypothetical protein